jgi:hypothetical protein
VNRNQVTAHQPLPTPPAANPSASGMARAVAMADPRQNMKPYDRAGMSRGRGQMHQAGIQAAQNYQQGMSQVFDDALQRQAANASAMQGLQIGQEQYGQALGALQAQAVYSQQMANLQRQGALIGLLGDM